MFWTCTEGNGYEYNHYILTVLNSSLGCVGPMFDVERAFGFNSCDVGYSPACVTGLYIHPFTNNTHNTT